MKKNLSILLALVVLALSGKAWAVQKREFPKDSRDNPVSHPLYGGYQYQRIATTGAKIICSGKCLLAGIIRGTGPITTALEVRDTAEAISGVGILVVGSAYYQLNESNYNQQPLPVLPILFGSGIQGQLNAASNGEYATFLYLDLD